MISEWNQYRFSNGWNVAVRWVRLKWNILSFPENWDQKWCNLLSLWQIQPMVKVDVRRGFIDAICGGEVGGLPQEGARHCPGDSFLFCSYFSLSLSFRQQGDINSTTTLPPGIKKNLRLKNRASTQLLSLCSLTCASSKLGRRRLRAWWGQRWWE